MNQKFREGASEQHSTDGHDSLEAQSIQNTETPVRGDSTMDEAARNEKSQYSDGRPVDGLRWLIDFLDREDPDGHLRSCEEVEQYILDKTASFSEPENG